MPIMTLIATKAFNSARLFSGILRVFDNYNSHGSSPMKTKRLSKTK